MRNAAVRWISQAELNQYTHWLATAVTEAMHYFIGHCCYSPHNETRYLAVTGAHITHMLRDTFDDVQAGYYNIPREVLKANNIQPQDIQSKAYRDWVRSRVNWHASIFKRAGDIWPRFRVRAADWQVLLIPPASNGCWTRSNRKIISFARSTQKGKASVRDSGWGCPLSLPHCFILESRKTLPRPVVSQSLRKL